MFTSLVDIIDSRQDLQDAIRDIPGFDINNWWLDNKDREYPGVTLVPPGDPRIEDPTTLTAEAQSARPSAALAPTEPPTLEPTPTLPPTIAPTTTPTPEPTDTATQDDIDIIDIPDDLPPQLQETLRIFQTQFEALVNIFGKTINADIKIDKGKTAEFLLQAQTEFGPFFEEQIGLNLTDLSREITDVIGEFGRTQEDILRQQKLGREQIGESAAERGVAFSTGRQRQERRLGEATQRVLGQAQRGALRETGRLGRIVEREIGTKRLKLGFQAPSLRPLSFTGATRQPISSFTPSVTPITGGLARQRTEAERLRVAQLEQSFKRQQVL